ncbi:hypothetical protein JCGZ_20371 [Jatropha curcas]|uniref:Growth-regulating factor n=1 Tax=Jatropha curcas TaxID=180498 RepID=A0A067JZ15_JATCU|nr:growth-regulating factor 8 [Jatropha curcas]KDP25215.1 hypothetical protein JCGZ_20371 [Jatropha curcas]
MGMRSGVSFVCSKEGTTAKECDVGLGLRMQDKESCGVISSPSSSSSSSTSCCCSGGGFDGGGPMFYGRSNGVACFGDIYDVVVGGSSSGGSNAVTGSKTSLHSFNSSPFAFNSSGEMNPSSMNVAVPFTAAQWQELERQTMIYKYMMASVPIPPELLIPITKTQSNPPSSQSHALKGSLELGISGCNSDPEPWRCKRTDGKKWRCSRDVAPDQKYCERHSHKSRPRSRKPVELHTDSMAQLLNQKSHFPNQTNSHNLSIFRSPTVSAAASYDQSRNLEWFLKGETVPVASNSNQEWRYLKDGERVYNYRQGQLDSNSYLNMNLRGGHPLQAHRLNENCSLLLSPKSTSLEANVNPSSQETRHFFDAWSSAVRESSNNGGIGNECCVSSGEKLLPLSSLTLSMAGGVQTNQDNGNEQAASFGMMGQEKMSHGSWMCSPPGGPLAEALCLGISIGAKADSNLASSHGSSYGINNKN